MAELLGLDFRKSTVVVTGDGSGIGEAVAALFVKLGASVWLMDASADALASAAKRMGGVAGVFAVDVTREDQIAKAFGSLKELHILVNCAGITGITATNCDKVPADNFRKVIEINLTGTFLTCKYALPFMVKQKYGRIINVASIAGKEGNAGMCAYSASKAGVIGLTKSLGKEYALGGLSTR